MPHTFACAMRWADMDLLGHVNNVRYLDYAAQARAAVLGDAAAHARVRRHRVQFVAPLVFRREPVMVDTAVTALDERGVHLAHEVYDDRDGQRIAHLRVSTELEVSLTDAERSRLAAYDGPEHEWRPVVDDPRPARAEYDVEVRASDLGPDGHVRDVMVFEYLQEARIRYLMDLHTRGQVWSHHVVARTDVQYLRPMDLGGRYRVGSWIGHLGTRSFTIGAQICADDVPVAEARVVMVTFDKETQRPGPMAETQRERLQTELDG